MLGKTVTRLKTAVYGEVSAPSINTAITVKQETTGKDSQNDTMGQDATHRKKA